MRDRAPARKIGSAGLLLRVQSRLGNALSGTSSLREGLRLCLEAALEISGMDCGGVYVMDRASTRLTLEVHSGLTPAFLRSQKRIPASSPFFKSALTRGPKYINGDLNFEAYSLPADSPERREGLKAIASLPVRAKGRVVACLNIGSHTVEKIPKPVRQALEAVAAQIGLSVTRLRAERDLRRSHGDLRRLAARLAETQEIERHRIARELHDQVGQTMAGLALHLDQLARNDRSGDDASFSNRLAEAVRRLRETTDTIRGVIADLRPPLLDDEGLSAALQWLASEFASRTNLPLNIWIEEPRPRLKPNVENALFRITQEALTNVQRHAQAERVVLSLETDESKAFLMIQDDGRGFDAGRTEASSSRTHWGLSIMRERACGVGGRFRIDSAPGAGTKILVEVPR